MPCRRPVTRDLTPRSNCIIPSKSAFHVHSSAHCGVCTHCQLPRVLDEPKMSQAGSNWISGHKLQQERIPVGCVPTAHRPYAGVCFPGGWCAWSRGVCVPGPGGRVCLVLGGGVPGPGGVCLSALWDTTTTPL